MHEQPGTLLFSPPSFISEDYVEWGGGPQSSRGYGCDQGEGLGGCSWIHE